MKSKYIVRQNDIKDCGICCLESIIKYYGGYIPLETLRLDTRTNHNGTTALNLIKTAKKYGFSAIGKKVNSITEEEIILPAIAHIITEKGLHHFVVIYKITNKFIYIMDPAKGNVKKEKEKFKKEWTNVLLIFKPYKKIPLYKNKNNIKKLFINILLNEKDLIKKIIFTNIIITILSVIISHYLKIVISNLENNYINTTLFIILFYFIVNIFKIIFEYIKNNLIIYLNKNIDLKVIPEFLEHLINLPLDVIKSRTSGEILVRVQELNNIKELFSQIFITIILNITIFTSSIYFLSNINSRLFLILCIITILYTLLSIIINPIINKKINDNIDLETEFNSCISEKIESLETIKNLSLNKKTLNELECKYTEYLYNNFKYLKFLNYIYFFKKIIKDIGLFTMNSFGIYLISQNKISLLSLITFNYLVSYFIEPVTEILEEIPKFNFIKLSFNKISEFLSIDEEKIGEYESFLPGDIEYKNITYSYNDYINIVENISFKIKENSHITIKGKTGSGKSTLYKMLNKNITGYKGEILIKDINIKDYSLRTLRKEILYVSQKEKIFNDTIKNNITLNKKVSTEELNEIIKLTEVDKILEKKSARLDTILYDSGSNLSGGERQRIILARTLLLKPKILILDESLSEIDKETEENILNRINKKYTNTTIIYITHTNTNCFNNVLEMDKIIYAK